MIISRRYEYSDASNHTRDTRAAGQAGLVPAGRFEEMLVRALVAPERSPESGRPAVFYVDVDRLALAAIGLTAHAIESAFREIGRRLVSWVGRTGAVTRRGADHFVLLRYPGNRTADISAGTSGDDGQHECDGDACERALDDLQRHFRRPMLVAGRRLCASGRVEMVDSTRAPGARWSPASWLC